MRGFWAGRTALSFSVCRWVLLDRRTDDGFSATIFLIPLSLYLSQGRDWHFSLDDCSQGDAILLCLVSGKEEEPTHTYEPRAFNRPSPTTLRSVLWSLRGSWG